MNYLAHIVNLINEDLDAVFPGDNAILYNIAQLAKKAIKNDAVAPTFPVVYDLNGMGKYVGPDDKYDTQVYHRILRLAIAPSTAGTYGSSRGFVTETAYMSMVVFSDRSAMQMTPEELQMTIRLAMPASIAKTESPYLKRVNINVTDVVLNTEQAFNEEFKNVDFFIGPEHIFFKVNYTIESLIDKSCFTKNCKTVK